MASAPLDQRKGTSRGAGRAATMAATQTAKAKTTSKASNGGGEAKTKTQMHRRSRTGCFTCRLRRKKCDEGAPMCTACRHLGLQCEYKRPIWWSNNEARRQHKEDIKNIIKRKKMAEKTASSQALEAGVSSSPPSLTHSLPTSATLTDPLGRTRSASMDSHLSAAFHFNSPPAGAGGYGVYVGGGGGGVGPGPRLLALRGGHQDGAGDVRRRRADAARVARGHVQHLPPAAAAGHGAGAGAARRRALGGAAPVAGRGGSQPQLLRLCPRPAGARAAAGAHRARGRRPAAAGPLHPVRPAHHLPHPRVQPARLRRVGPDPAGAAGQPGLPPLLPGRGGAAPQDARRRRRRRRHRPGHHAAPLRHHLLAVRGAQARRGPPADPRGDAGPDPVPVRRGPAGRRAARHCLAPALPGGRQPCAEADLPRLVSDPAGQAQEQAQAQAQAQTPFNMTLTGWIDILGATMQGTSPTFAHTYREKHLSARNHHLGLRELMGCEDRVMYLISEIACLESLKRDGMDDLTLCQHVSALGEQLSLTEVNETGPRTPYKANGSLSPKQLSRNMTAAFRLAARIYLCSLVPGFGPSQPSPMGLVDKLTGVLQHMPGGRDGFDRSLVWVYLIGGSFSLPGSGFRALLEERVVRLGELAACGSFGRMVTVLGEVWAQGDGLLQAAASRASSPAASDGAGPQYVH